jgi:hypothetical protein
MIKISTKFHLLAFVMIAVISACSESSESAKPDVKEGADSSYPPIHIVRQGNDLDLDGWVHLAREQQRFCLSVKESVRTNNPNVEIPDSALENKKSLKDAPPRKKIEEFFDGRRYFLMESDIYRNLDSESCKFKEEISQSAEIVVGCQRTQINYDEKTISIGVDSEQPACREKKDVLGRMRVLEVKAPPKGEIKSVAGVQCIAQGAGGGSHAEAKTSTATTSPAAEDIKKAMQAAMKGDASALEKLTPDIEKSADARIQKLHEAGGYPCLLAKYPYYFPLGNREVQVALYPSEMAKKFLREDALVEKSWMTAKGNVTSRSSGDIEEPISVEIGRPIPSTVFEIPADARGFRTLKE